MKKILLILVMLMGLSGIVVGNAQAALISGLNLSVPDIFSDSTGTFSYTASSGLFTSSAIPFTVTFGGAPIFITGTKSYLASFYVDAAGNFSGGVGGADLTIIGNIDVNGDLINEYSGTLLTGEVTNFGWLDSGTEFDLFNYTFNATGGALVGFYVAGTGGGDAMSSETSTFTGSFTSNFGSTGFGKTKHDTAPLVPEPGSMLLLGMGILGIFGLKRKVKA